LSAAVTMFFFFVWTEYDGYVADNRDDGTTRVRHTESFIEDLRKRATDRPSVATENHTYP